jgi:hypothetical protein
MADLMRLPKPELVALIGRLAGELEQARAGEPAEGAVQRQVALWLLGLELPQHAEPVAAVVARLAVTADSWWLTPTDLAQVARELRAAMAEVRELVPSGDDDDEADPLGEEVARLKAG